jgi:hypothetical protein
MIVDIFLAYLALGFVFALVWYGANVYSDITQGPDHKFGWAYKSGMTFIMCGVLICPIINFYGFYIVTAIFVDDVKRMIT